MLSEYRKLVYADDRYNGTIVRLSEIHFTASGFSQRFLTVCAFFVFVSFWSCFLSESAHYEKQKKQQHENNNNLQTV